MSSLPRLPKPTSTAADHPPYVTRPTGWNTWERQAWRNGAVGNECCHCEQHCTVLVDEGMWVVIGTQRSQLIIVNRYLKVCHNHFKRRTMLGTSLRLRFLHRFRNPQVYKCPDTLSDTVVHQCRVGRVAIAVSKCSYNLGHSLKGFHHALFSPDTVHPIPNQIAYRMDGYTPLSQWVNESVTFTRSHTCVGHWLNVWQYVAIWHKFRHQTCDRVVRTCLIVYLGLNQSGNI